MASRPFTTRRVIRRSAIALSSARQALNKPPGRRRRHTPKQALPSSIASYTAAAYASVVYATAFHIEYLIRLSINEYMTFRRCEMISRAAGNSLGEYFGIVIKMGMAKLRRLIYSLLYVRRFRLGLH